MSQRWRMVVWGAGLAVGLCFGMVEEGEGVCVFSQKWRLVVLVSDLAVSQQIAKTTNTKQSQQTQEYPQV